MCGNALVGCDSESVFLPWRSKFRGRVDFAPFQQGVETLLLGAILKACFCLGALMGEKKN